MARNSERRNRKLEEHRATRMRYKCPGGCDDNTRMIRYRGRRPGEFWYACAKCGNKMVKKNEDGDGLIHASLHDVPQVPSNEALPEREDKVQ